MKKDRIFGILLSIILLAVVLYRADLDKVAAALRGADYRYLPLAISVYLTSFLFRSWRWRVILSPVKPGIKFGEIFSTIIIGWTANNLLPARAGELVRAYLIGRKESISKSASLATIVIERVLDGFVLLVFLFFCMLFITDALQILRFAFYLLAALLAVVFVLIFMVFRSRLVLTWIERRTKILSPRASGLVNRISQSFIRGLESLRDARVASTGLAFTAGIWIVEAFVYYIILRSFGLMLPVYAAVVLLAVVNVGVLLPSAPGAIGVFQFFCVLALGFFSVDESTALGLSVILQSMMWLPVTLLGLIFLSRIPSELRFRTR